MSLVILCASETGNSLDYANRASEDFERIGIEAPVEIADEFDLERLVGEVKVLIFVGSTCGDGECPRNMRAFMNFLLRADLPANLLDGIDYAVFGLGDSSYDKFNFVGKRVYRRLAQLGAQDLVGFRGEGDEANSGGIEVGWSAWFPKVKLELLQSDKIFKRHKIYSELEPLPPRHYLKDEANPIENADYDESPQLLDCNVVDLRRVTPEDHFQDVRLISIEITSINDYSNNNDDFRFLPGDVLSMKPNNDPGEVDEFLALLNLNGDLIIYGIEGSGFGNWHPSQLKGIKFPCSLRDFVLEWIDFKRVPSKATLKTLATLCDLSAAAYSPLHQEKLLELSTDEGEYLDYIWRPKRSILEVIRDFQPTLSAGIPVKRLLQVFAPVKARQFSIANDPRIDGRIELLVALVEEELPLGRGMRSGLCSKWISSGNIFSELRGCSMSRGSIDFGKISRSEQVFLFAAGTGIAPLRSIIQALSENENSNKQIFLYFGCREMAKDFYFKDEWRRYSNLKVFVAGSRDRITVERKKFYLNDLIKMNCEPILALKSFEDASFTVTGHSRLPKIVFEAVKEIWCEAGRRSLIELEEFKKSGKFQTETWS